jgi:hypothetical protein
MADKPKITQPSRRLPGVTPLHVNHIIPEFTKLDFTLEFSTLVKTETESEIHVYPQIHSAVGMSWPEAKILAITLLINIANNEERDSDIGTIRIPKGTLQNLVPDGPEGICDRPLMEILEHIMQSRKAAKDTTPTVTN